jgi:hypothetical protein
MSANGRVSVAQFCNSDMRVWDISEKKQGKQGKVFFSRKKKQKRIPGMYALGLDFNLRLR